MGLANFALFVHVMITSFLGPALSEWFGPSIMFLVFAIITLSGLIYMLMFIEDTTFVYGENEQRIKDPKAKRFMVLEEKKLVYTPKEFLN